MRPAVSELNHTQIATRRMSKFCILRAKEEAARLAALEVVTAFGPFLPEQVGRDALGDYDDHL